MNKQDLELTNKMLSSLETLLDAEAKIFKRGEKHVVQLRLQLGKKDVYITASAERIGYCIEWFSIEMASHTELNEGKWTHAKNGMVVDITIENVKPLN